MTKPTWRRIRKALGFATPTRSLDSDSASRRAARLAADAARERGDWDRAAGLYAQALEGDAENLAMQIQHAHALKESRRLLEAEAAYRRAIALSPDQPEIHLHLGHLLRLQGRPSDAADAYAQAMVRDPDYAPARDELVALGARGRLPHQAYGRDAATDRLSRLSAALERVEAAAGELAIVSSFPVEAWDAFRRAHVTPPAPPSMAQTMSIDVWIDARGKPPSAVRVTLDSLLDQSQSDWRAVVIGDADLAGHPVAGLARRDTRICFSDTPPPPSERAVLQLDAGTVLDPAAVDWFSRAQKETGADVVYADHDHHSRHWRAGRTYFDPALFSAPDPDDLETVPVLPAAVMSAPHVQQDFRPLRSVLINAASRGKAAHLPLVLTSRSVDGPACDMPSESFTPDDQPDVRVDTILLVIPTRDEAEMLRVCIDSLRAKADQPDALDILVLDNRSREDATKVLLQTLASAGVARWRDMDEPFNWSRFNNLAVENAQADLFVFCNNDIEALSQGWDTRLRLDLARTEIGVVGARLLYPDGTLQHAGVVMGRGEGRPIHEGLHSRPGQAGPLARWRRRRRVAAVTGAFMALRRDAFTQLGGFDEGLAVGYNDIDLCLRCRRAGLGVLYDPGLTLTHHESKTRGFNDGGERTLWDDGELERLYARWGEDLFRDMSINPRWVSANSRVFDGYRDVGPRAALDWLRRSALPDPWRTGHGEDDAV